MKVLYSVALGRDPKRPNSPAFTSSTKRPGSQFSRCNSSNLRTKPSSVRIHDVTPLEKMNLNRYRYNSLPTKPADEGYRRVTWKRASAPATANSGSAVVADPIYQLTDGPLEEQQVTGDLDESINVETSKASQVETEEESQVAADKEGDECRPEDVREKIPSETTSGSVSAT